MLQSGTDATAITPGSVVYEKRDFSLHEGIPLPVDTLHRRVEDHHLFISPAKAAYVVTGDVGAAAVSRLLTGESLGQVLATVGGDVGCDAGRVQRGLQGLLLQIEKNNFYEHATPVEDVMTNAPVLCYLTHRCNLRCTHCYQEAGPTVEVTEDLSGEEWAQVFTGYGGFLAAHSHLAGKITLSGGEPMVRRDFFDIAAAAKSEGALLEVFTNGTLVRNQDTARRLANLADQVQVSLDGASEEVNDSVRGRGSHRKILRALRLLAATGVRLRVAVTLMPCNADDLAENLMPLLREFGHGRVEVRIGLANIQGRATSRVRFRDTVEGERVLRDLLARLYAEGLRRPRSIQTNFRQVSCGYGRSITLAADGTVYGCAIESFPLGNVRLTPFREIAERVHGLATDTEVPNLETCRDCEVRHFCNGGCRLNNFFRHGDLRRTACTPDKKDELMRKLVRRELSEDPALVAAEAQINGFWA